MGIIDTIKKAESYDKLMEVLKEKQLNAALNEAQVAKEGLASLLAQKEEIGNNMKNLLSTVDNYTFTQLANHPIMHRLIGTDNITTVANNRTFNELLRRI